MASLTLNTRGYGSVRLCRCDLVMSWLRLTCCLPPNAAGRGSPPDGWDRRMVGRSVSCVYKPEWAVNLFTSRDSQQPWRYVRLHHSDTTIIRSFPSLGCVKSTHSIKLVNIHISCCAAVYTVKLYPRIADIQATAGSKLFPGPFRLSGQCLHSYWQIIWKVLASLTLLPLPGFTHTHTWTMRWIYAPVNGIIQWRSFSL